MSSLICPICETALKPIQIPHAAIWQCESCQAVTANLAVLRRHLRKDVVKGFWRRAIAAARSTDKRCPSCRKPLRGFTVQRSGQNINLDVCRRCQLVWFDKGELDAFPKTKTEQLPPEVRHKLALIKVRSETEQLQAEETADKVFTILALGRISLLCFPWYLIWIIDIFVRLFKFVLERKGWLWAAAVIICGVGFCIGAYVLFRPREVVYPKNPLSPDYQRNMNYLLRASGQAPADFSKIRGGFHGYHIPIVQEQDFPAFTNKLRQELYNAARKDFLYHRIVVGGMDVRDIDEPLLKASYGLRIAGRSNIEIVIVEPSMISDDTKKILEERGLRISRLESR